MYPLDPRAVYVHEEVASDPLWMSRVERVVSSLANPVEPTVFADLDLPDLVNNLGLLAHRRPMQSIDDVKDPALLFNTFRFDGGFEERCRQLRATGLGSAGALRPLLGYGAYHWACYNLEGDAARHDKVCRPCWRIHLQNGCVHRCAYCSLGGLLISSVNIEQYCTHLAEIIARHPWQTTYLLDDDADTPCLEPEHGVLSELIEFFGTLKDRYLIIHTKTWNTAWMRDLKHNGNTIIVWSISGPNQSRLLEPKTGTTEERVQAARMAEEAGYQIRYKFKPIIPVHGWRDDAAYTVKRLFEETNPDIISLCVFMWHDYSGMAERLPLDLLDPEFVGAAEESQEQMAHTRSQPFPPSVREAIYAHHVAEIRTYNDRIPVSLSTENFAMWKAFGPRLGSTATNYVCGCGPQCGPGARHLPGHPFADAVRDSEGIPCVY